MIWKLENSLFIKSLKVSSINSARTLKFRLCFFCRSPPTNSLKDENKKIVNRGQIWSVGRVVEVFLAYFLQFFYCQNSGVRPDTVIEKDNISYGHASTFVLLALATGKCKPHLPLVDRGKNLLVILNSQTILQVMFAPCKQTVNMKHTLGGKNKEFANSKNTNAKLSEYVANLKKFYSSGSNGKIGKKNASNAIPLTNNSFEVFTSRADDIYYVLIETAIRS